MPRNLVVLGSTGSIGRQTLEVAAAFPEQVRVYGLAAGHNAIELQRQIAAFHPRAVSSLAPLLCSGVESLPGPKGMIELVSRAEVDLVVVGTVGAAGLAPTLAALRAGKLVALANKEVLVMAGQVIHQVLQEGRGELVPIDSEHSAIWQCLQGEPGSAVERLTLTASGGALRHLPLEQLKAVTPEQALQHPTWSMGAKITVDSATLMNKGLEVIEARWLFDLPQDRIEVVAHPQSIIHSLVTFADGSTKAQLGLPDMRLPIQYALSHPQRWPNSLARLDLAAVGELTFGPVDLARYPALGLALEAGRQGGGAPAVLSAADEIAVGAFLQQRLPFTEIPSVVAATLAAHPHCPAPDLESILDIDEWARRYASRLIATKGSL